VEFKEQYQIKHSASAATLKNLHEDVDEAWKNTKENVKLQIKRVYFIAVTGTRTWVSPTSLACAQKQNKCIYCVNQGHYPLGN
jgi:hypothetical protein